MLKLYDNDKFFDDGCIHMPALALCLWQMSDIGFTCTIRCINSLIYACTCTLVVVTV